MKNRLKISRLIAGAAAAVMILGASAASAATFNFVAIADNSLDPNYIGSTELNWADTTFASGLTIGGVTLTASGFNGDETSADAFFDKDTAGLGVCSSTSCATGVAGAVTSDDNVSGAASGETLRLSFDQAVNIFDITFRAANHTLLTGSVNLAGLGALGITGGAVTSGADYLLAQSVFDFEYSGDEFYISVLSVQPVPLPAGGLLLLTGFGALALRRRRKAT